MNDADIPACLGRQRDARVGGHRGGGGHARHDLEPDPGLGARGGAPGGRPEQERIAVVGRHGQLAGLHRLDQQPRIGLQLGQVADLRAGGEQMPNPVSHLGGGEHQVRPAQQPGGAHREQLRMARPGAHESRQPRLGRPLCRCVTVLVGLAGRVLLRCGSHTHNASSPLLMYSEDAAAYVAAPWRSNSAATSRPRRPASAAGAVALARNADPPSSAATTALSCSISVPAAYAPTGALQPAGQSRQHGPFRGHRGPAEPVVHLAQQCGQVGVTGPAFHRQRALSGRGQHLFRLEDLGCGVQPADPGQPGAG